MGKLLFPEMSEGIYLVFNISFVVFVELFCLPCNGIRNHKEMFDIGSYLLMYLLFFARTLMFLYTYFLLLQNERGKKGQWSRREGRAGGQRM